MGFVRSASPTVPIGFVSLPVGVAAPTGDLTPPSSALMSRQRTDGAFNEQSLPPLGAQRATCLRYVTKPHDLVVQRSDRSRYLGAASIPRCSDVLAPHAHRAVRTLRR